MTEAKIIADSVSPHKQRLTTMEVTLHRYVLAELNTHRVFSRNSASSRAIPVQRQLDRVLGNCAFPVSWPLEQKGMQGGEEMDPLMRDQAHQIWEAARDDAVASVQKLKALGLHKSVTNRLLEPFMWHTVIVSSTEWENFFTQRCSPLAQPEIRAAALLMREVYYESDPQLVEMGDWHLPYIDGETLLSIIDFHPQSIAEGILRKVSVARCARVSYLTHDGQRDYKEDLKLYDRLVSANPMHASPLEHVATPTETFEMSGCNFRGWAQLRHKVEWEAHHYAK